MEVFRTKSAAEQLADFLHEQIIRGIWQNLMPGAPTLARNLGVDHRMVISAFEILEKKGLLVSEGVGKRRRIVMIEERETPAMKFHIICYEESDVKLFYLVDLQHKLMEAGHICAFSSVTLKGVGMNLDKLKRHVEKTKVDAWIVFAGSREILEWFSLQKTPAFAMAGRMNGINIPGCRPDKIHALNTALRRLIELGHERIVLIVREERRKPLPGMFERAFLHDLESHGIKIGSYNLPDWADNAKDLHRCLDSLFRHTPPTAIIVDEIQHFTAAQLHLAHMGILAPRDVSLICTDPNPAFNWCQPTVSHIDWDSNSMVRRILRWADHVARGIDDRKQDFTPARFVEAGSTGRVPRL